MQRAPGTRPPASRWLFGMAAALIACYVVNVALRIAAIKFGASPWRLGDVGEFILVLSGMVFFVAALIVDEERQAAPDDQAVVGNPTQGGV